MRRYFMLLGLVSFSAAAQNCTALRDAVAAAERDWANAAGAVQKLDLEIARDRDAFERAGFKRTPEGRASDDFSDWLNLGQEAQTDAQLTALNNLLSQILQGLADAVHTGKSLNPFNASKYMKEHDVTTSFGKDLVRTVSRMKGKPNYFPAIEKSLVALEAAHTGATLEEKGSRLQSLEEAGDLLSSLLGTPQYAMLVGNAKMLAADAYSAGATYTANQGLEQLTSMSELQLRSWLSLNRVMLDHVAQKKDAVQRLRDAEQERDNRKHSLNAAPMDCGNTTTRTSSGSAPASAPKNGRKSPEPESGTTPNAGGRYDPRACDECVRRCWPNAGLPPPGYGACMAACRNTACK